MEACHDPPGEPLSLFDRRRALSRRAAQDPRHVACHQWWNSSKHERRNQKVVCTFFSRQSQADVRLRALLLCTVAARQASSACTESCVVLLTRCRAPRAGSSLGSRTTARAPPRSKLLTDSLAPRFARSAPKIIVDSPYIMEITAVCRRSFYFVARHVRKAR